MFLKRWKNNYKGTDKLVQDNDSYEGSFCSLLPFAWFFHSGEQTAGASHPCVCDVVPWVPVRITTAVCDDREEATSGLPSRPFGMMFLVTQPNPSCPFNRRQSHFYSKIDEL